MIKEKDTWKVRISNCDTKWNKNLRKIVFNASYKNGLFYGIKHEFNHKGFPDYKEKRLYKYPKIVNPI